ncbi:MAG: glucose-6-phosphate isomerase [Eubacterium sp.]|jgi:glucose-6-phosphate isomerase|nr:glucose-6-phosphate isomerase [Eubacterium sp.]MCH4047175.1 glucose-6-phosphate isomerase [Eubacterium sp.]MCH4080273.1 glucose-6-phosphate isomerase [Eubacterium sp.]MCH4110834.1 glucose-6-phosphate isomerase [Eubacterium sp.]MCI1308062.1 glucose-6-phosphate isomerase [Eubacterium sp.]
MTEWRNFDELKSFQTLKNEQKIDLPAVMAGESGAERVRKYSVPMAEGLQYNFAAKSVDDTILSDLAELAQEAELSDKFKELYEGAVINTGEKRLVLHHLTRGQLGGDVIADGVNKREFYLEQQKRIADFARDVHEGKIVNEHGEKFTAVVQIGIGGSDLGPRAMYLALQNWAKANKQDYMDAAFISNVDPDDAASVLASVDVAHAIFILVSKSGTTLETLTNETFVQNALRAQGLDPAHHMIAVTSETSPLAHNDDYMAAFYMDDYIGGRYSSTSAVGGAVLSLAFGPEVFTEFLEGAAAEDQLAKEADPLKNPDMLDALIGVYERNFLGYESTAVLPYSQALSRFPAHLQQLDMESNGKSVNRFGEPVSYPTGPVLFGEPGTNGQHSFYQLLHQGKNIVPLQFVGFRKSQLGVDDSIQGSTSQQKLCANVAAQIVAFACGKPDENRNKNFEGGRPSSIIIGDEVTPRSLGALLAHFENKVMFQGFVWNLNSFDQEGVQLGKLLAKRVLAHDTEGALAEYSRLLNI